MKGKYVARSILDVFGTVALFIALMALTVYDSSSRELPGYVLYGVTTVALGLCVYWFIRWRMERAYRLTIQELNEELHKENLALRRLDRLPRLRQLKEVMRGYPKDTDG
jgi:hypothetical protein